RVFFATLAGLLAPLVLAAAADAVLAAHGYSAALMFVLGASLVWYVSASLGSTLILVLDASASALLTTFRSRVRALVLALLALACTTSMVLAPKAFQLLSASEVLSPWWRDGFVGRLSGRMASIPGFSDLLRGSSPGVSFLFALTTLIALPSVLSATGKLAG